MKNVVCVNTGTKYEKKYVQNLYNMVQRNIEGEFAFYVITDQRGIYDKPIKPVYVDDAEGSWWDKFNLFRPNVLDPGNYLYLDLDVIVVGNLDSYFNRPGLGAIRDFIRPEVGLLGNKEYNSSVMSFNTQECNGVYTWFKDNEHHWRNYQKQIHFFGDQNVISEYLNYYEYFSNPFPDEEISSFKKGIERGKHTGDRSEWFGRHLTGSEKIVVFHGSPTPLDIISNPEEYLKKGPKFCTLETIKWIKENWM